MWGNARADALCSFLSRAEPLCWWVASEGCIPVVSEGGQSARRKQGCHGKQPPPDPLALGRDVAPAAPDEPGAAPRCRPGCPGPGGSLSSVRPAAEANAISENTETLHLSPPVSTGHVGLGAEKGREVCEHSCEELGSMIQELSGLHVIVSQLHENLRKVVGARAAWLEGDQARLTPPERHGPPLTVTDHR